MGKRVKKMKSMLPPLVFGGRTTPLVRSPTIMGAQLKPVIKGLERYESLSKQGDFVSQSSLVTIKGLNLAATASTPIQYKIGSAEGAVLLIPFLGEGVAKSSDGTFNYRAGTTAVVLHGDGLSGICSARSILAANIDIDRLELTARGMLGISSNMNLLNLQACREINLRVGKVSFDAIFRQYASLIDQFMLNSELLNKTGIDDCLYSAMAMMLRPELFFDTFNLPAETRYNKKLLDKTCQHIHANLTQPITLAGLDKVSGMSRRKLHYAFQLRYECSPMQWVRTERLSQVQNQLAHAQADVTVTEVAMSYGFTKMSTFAQYYKKQFGELPSTTLSTSPCR
jgi:AraC-like DNA-binding protein